VTAALETGHADTPEGDVERPSPGAVLDKLAQLGTPNAIAEFLYRNGITGELCRPYSCPIARFVAATTGDDVLIHTETFICDDGNWGELPDVIAEFIDRFDDYHYPQLADHNSAVLFS
jgi:hypothetical protein